MLGIFLHHFSTCFLRQGLPLKLKPTIVFSFQDPPFFPSSNPPTLGLETQAAIPRSGRGLEARVPTRRQAAIGGGERGF